MNFWGQTRYWWVVLIVGILLAIGGIAYWYWPAVGFAVVSQLFGWLLLVVGIVQICVSAGEKRPQGWGWWLAGGILDLFVGFLFVRSVVLSELLFPYFLAVIFIFWGVATVVSAVSSRSTGIWWLYLVNGILLMVIGFFFLEAGWYENMIMVSMVASLAFIYWGFTVAIVSYDMKPRRT